MRLNANALDRDKHLADVKSTMSYLQQFAALGVIRWFNGLTKGEKMKALTGIIGYVLKMDFFDGYRGYLTGIAAILGGLAVLVLYASGNPEAHVEVGIGAVLFGLKALSDAGKADKQIEATKAAAVLNVALAPDPPSPTPSMGVGEKEIRAAINVVKNLPTATPTSTNKPSDEPSSAPGVA